MRRHFEESLDRSRDLDADDPLKERHKLLAKSPLVKKLRDHDFQRQVVDADYGPTRVTPMVNRLARQWFRLTHPKAWKVLVPRGHDELAQQNGGMDMPVPVGNLAGDIRDDRLEQDMASPYDSDGDTIVDEDDLVLAQPARVDNRPRFSARRARPLSAQHQIDPPPNEPDRFDQEGLFCDVQDITLRYGRLDFTDAVHLQIGDVVEVMHETRHAASRYAEARKHNKRVLRKEHWFVVFELSVQHLIDTP